VNTLKFRKYLPYAQISFACLIWGSYGLFVQGVEQPPQVIVFFRFLFGFLSLLFLINLTKDWKKIIVAKKWGILVLAGAINTLSWLLITRSIQLTTVTNGFILYYTAPCFVVFLAPLFLREKIRKTAIPALILCFCGIVIINIGGAGGWNPTTFNWLSNLMGLGSGVFYGLYIILLKKVPPDILGLVSNIYVCGVISGITFPMAFPYLVNINLKDLLMLVLAGISIQGIATSIYMIGLRKVSAQHASILSYLEVLFASLLAVIFLNENISPPLIIGSIMVIGGGMLVVFDNSGDEREIGPKNIKD
jgi:drug/metabolite transporter (DMT)-like permease